MNYNKTTPCDLCPFRNDAGRLTVSAARMAEMASGEFACHKTTELQDNEDGGSEFTPHEKSQHCAGALIFLEHLGKPHQMMRICERLGMYDASKLDMNAPVFTSFAEVNAADRKKPKTRRLNATRHPA